jgi:hypothetical protein
MCAHAYMVVWVQGLLLRDYGDVREGGTEAQPIEYGIDCQYDANTDRLVLFTGDHA